MCASNLKFELQRGLGRAEEFSMKDSKDQSGKIFPLKKTLEPKTWKFTLSRPRLAFTGPKGPVRKAG